MTNMRETEYYKSGKQLENLKKARQAAVSIKIECQYCSEKRTKGNIKKHEASCYLNPKNMRLCIVCQAPIKNCFVVEQVTCSYSCSNKHFRTGPGNGNWKENSYRSTCFHHHKMECVICQENKVVEVHHLDENHNNNSPENLIPLCPTHHQYWHSKYKYLIENNVIQYVEKWKTSRLIQ